MAGTVPLSVPALVLLILSVAKAQDGVFYSYLDGLAAPASDDGSTSADLQQPFNYFGRSYSQIHINHNGQLTFDAPYTALYPDDFETGARDLIAPLWTDLNNAAGGTIYYQEVTSGPLLERATAEINTLFPTVYFSASSVFTATWDGVPDFAGNGVTQIQVIFISGGPLSFIMMNYLVVPDTSQNWRAGYTRVEEDLYFSIPVAESEDLPLSSNVNINGRWVFRVDGGSDGIFYPYVGAAAAPSADDGSTTADLQHPFNYFGRSYSQIHINHNGQLTFDAPYTALYPDDFETGARDLIAPLWTDLNNAAAGTIYYQEVTSGPLLERATAEINTLFPTVYFSASSVFTATWDGVPDFAGNGVTQIQVIFISGGPLSFIMMNYLVVPDTSQNWRAGYTRVEEDLYFSIPVAESEDLPLSSNVNINGRWAFRVDGGSDGIFYPYVGAAAAPSADDGSTTADLQHPFNYFGRSYSQIHINHNGQLTFDAPYTALYPDDFETGARDLIAPLWTDLNNAAAGVIYYQEVTSGPLLERATMEISTLFPDLSFSASSVFTATWDGVPDFAQNGVVHIQVIFISGGDLSFIMLNYAGVPDTSQNWRAGYTRVEEGLYFSIPVAESEDLPFSSNVNINGRWVFRVDGGSEGVYYPFVGAAAAPASDDGSTTAVLQQPFNYFGRSYSQIHINHNGQLTFDAPYTALYPDDFETGARDLIAPLWTDLNNAAGGTIYYQEVTSGPLLERATAEINTLLPTLSFSASSVFTATWDGVPDYAQNGVAHVQAVLISGGHLSFIMLNYNGVPDTDQNWRAGYTRVEEGRYFSIPVAESEDLPSSSNVNIDGRWVFRVDGGADDLFYLYLDGQAAAASDDGSTTADLQQPFNYFGRSYSQIHINHNGQLTFDAPYTALYPDDFETGARDLIAPLWTDLNNAAGGTIYYQEVTSGPLLERATAEINALFPDLSFSASSVFTATWDGVPDFAGNGVVHIQVIFISGGDLSFIVLNYGAVPDTSQNWRAGYTRVEEGLYFSIPVAESEDLPSSSNVNINGRWVFRVDGGSEVPEGFFPFGDGDLQTPVSDDGSSEEIILQQPFNYFGRTYNQIYVNNNGHLTFTEPFSEYSPYSGSGRDIIFPLWTDLNNGIQGTVSYRQATDSATLNQVTSQINQYFPDVSFAASWVFIATWNQVSYYSGAGAATFQVVLVSSGDVSFLLLNYGDIDATEQLWMAGYDTEDSSSSLTIPAPGASDLSSGSNVEVMGRWAFRVNHPAPAVLFPFGDGDLQTPVSDDGSSEEIILQQPFNYFGRTYNQIYVNNNGHLTFTEPFSEYSPYSGSGRDIIFPLWTDLNNGIQGTVSYRQATDSATLNQVTSQINQYFPDVSFAASWVFIATWNQVSYYSGAGAATFQVVLVSSGDVSFLLLNYGDIDATEQLWMAGYDTEDSSSSLTIPAPGVSDLSSGSNVEVMGRWAFRVNHPAPAVLFPFGDGDLQTPVSDDGSSEEIILQQPFNYFGRTYNQIYVNNNGHLTFTEPFSEYSPYSGSGRDIIFPLWTDLNNGIQGTVSYRQATDSATLNQVTSQINQYFPDVSFAASWVFIATWNQVSYYSGAGAATFQVVLVSSGDVSFLLLNYGDIDATEQLWMAGYDTEDSSSSLTIPAPGVSDLSSGSNVEVMGRWAFRVDHPAPAVLFPFGDGDLQTPVSDDGSSEEIILQQPFNYFGRTYNQIYVNNNGHLTFTEPFSEYSPYSGSGRDIIFPLWTDLNNGIQGTVSYRQATDSATLNQVTSQINQYFPDVSFAASWVFIATWNQVSYYSGAGAATFQVVLVSSGDVSFLLLNYGDIDATEQLWMAGYDTEDSSSSLTIPAPGASDLSSGSNVEVMGRWAFRVNHPAPAVLFPFGDGDLQTPVSDDGSSEEIILQQPFNYFGRTYNQIYVNNNGHLTFTEPFSEYSPYSGSGRDIIFPLWTDLNNGIQGTVSYRQATDSATLNQVTSQINQYFPDVSFAASWVFIATWNQVSYYSGAGAATFQVVLVSSGDVSFLLLNYGDIDATEQLWMAGYDTEDSSSSLTIPAPGASDLSSGSNVEVMGRWAFRVNHPAPAVLFPFGDGDLQTPVSDDGSSEEIILQQPFNYFGRTYNQIYVNNNGHLTFTEPFSEYSPYSGSGRDIIFPLWTDLNNGIQGTVSYRQATDSATLNQVTSQINQYFPDVSFAASWVFIATWNQVSYYSGAGAATFQVVLVSSGDVSFLLLNYGDIDATEQLWMAGYDTEDSSSSLTIPAPGASDLSSGSNVEVMGRWAFRVNHPAPAVLFPFGDGDLQTPVSDDGSSEEIILQQPFNYFGRTYNQIYVNNNGHLTFTEPFSEYSPYSGSGRDIIFPLWTDLNNGIQGTVSYRQATDSATLNQVTSQINQYFPDVSFAASWVFIATWNQVSYYSGAGAATFQVLLVSSGDVSFLLLNYGDIDATEQLWMAGYDTEDSSFSLAIPAPGASDLSSGSNVEVMGRWAFRVNHPAPAVLFPFGDGDLQTPVSDDGSSEEIILQQPFNYFGRTYNQIYVNNNGHLTFTEPFSEYSPYSGSGRDIIFPLWTDLNNGIQGTVSYRQATDSATLNQVTSQINQYFPDVSFAASWVFIATWNQVSYYSGAGAATFQVVLVSSGDVSFLLLNYGDIDATEQLWMAGYDTEDSSSSLTIPAPGASDLSSGSNVEVMGRWAFRVNHPAPAVLFPFGDGDLQTPVSDDGSSEEIILQQPFNYFGRTYNQIYVNNNGHLTFTEPFSEYSPYSGSGRDIIFPLWTDLNNGIQGTVSYRQATDSATLNQVTSQINQYFPDVSFAASWVFIATWNQVSYYSGAGAATFQVVLVSSGDVSFLLLNYGDIDATEQLWMAGYDTEDSSFSLAIPAPGASDLSSGSNVEVMGRWAFRVNHPAPAVLFPFGDGDLQTPVSDDGSSEEIILQQPFNYFGRTYNQIYVNNNGHLTFTEPFSEYSPYSGSGRDIIFPLWTDLNNGIQGTVSYRQATDSATLNQVTSQINQYFPDVSFAASWVFIATWNQVSYYSGAGAATFQVLLVSSGDVSFLLLNYGDIDATEQLWMAGYDTEDSSFSLAIPAPGASDLSSGSNVEVMGRWAFRVNHPAPAVLFPSGDGDLQTPVSDDGSSEEIILQQPFNYFGRTYNQIYVNNNGHLTFTEPFSEYSPYSGSGRDIIFPLWTDLNNGIQGTVSYRQATDSATLNQVTSQINQYFPDVSFAASWVFIATWNQVSYYSGAGAATFQVVLVSSGDVSFILMNYGDIDATEQLWMAGYDTEDSSFSLAIPAPGASDLSSGSNVEVMGRWAFRVNHPAPAVLFPFGDGDLQTPVSDDGSSEEIILQQPFNYFGRTYNQIYVNNNGHLTFTEPFSEYSPYSGSGRDIIFPLWTDLNNGIQGTVSYRQATDSATLNQVTSQINQYFPDVSFAASWVFIATWNQVSYYSGAGAATFQVLLVSSGDVSFILMNYGNIDATEQLWMAGYDTEDSSFSLAIPAPGASDLSSGSNVEVMGRWAFRVNHPAPAVLFPSGDGDLQTPVSDDGSSEEIILQQPFNYFGRTYNQIYVNNNGHLTFTEPFSEYSPYSNSGRDIIFPLWTDLNNGIQGTVSYRQATDSATLNQVTSQINQYFPDVSFAASWVFIATWNQVSYYSGAGAATFQVLLVSSGDVSFILMNYGNIDATEQLWMAGYDTEDSSFSLAIPAPGASDLSSGSNVEVMGRWAFRVDHPASAVLFPFGDGDLQTPVSDDGSSEEIILQQPFNYFGRTYNQIYVNNNGHLTFTEPFSEYSPYSGSGRDIIFPLWTDLNNGIQGTVSYRQATDSATLNQVTSQINQYFPDVSFAASWVFIATWNQVSYYSGAGAATFQVLLVSSGDVSFILMNYGNIDATEQLWMAGYDTEDSSFSLAIPAPGASDLSSGSNVEVMGRWAFRVDHPAPAVLFPSGDGDLQTPVSDDGSSEEIILQQPFNYFGRTYNQIYVNNNGHLTFTEPFSEYSPYSNSGRDIIFPLWTDLNNGIQGTVSYRQATDSATLNQVTSQINQYFPDVSFAASWVFIATWNQVSYYSGAGAATFQVLLVSSGDVSFILMNYGNIDATEQLWMAGYDTEDSASSLTIPASSASDLSSSSNVEVSGRWAFRVDSFTPSVLLPFGFGDTETPVSDDGSSEEIILQQPFNYFGRTYNQIYVNNNGHLTFTEPFSEYSPYSNSGRDIIFPLWTDLNNGIQGTVSYRQATDSATLNQVTSQINQNFPDVSFTASWVFIATWNQVSYYSGAGDATFQVVLVSNGDLSFILMNYGDITSTEQLWLAGYDTEDSAASFTIPASSASDLSSSSNVDVLGRWAFRVDRSAAALLFPTGDGDTLTPFSDDGSSEEIILQQPFNYFGRTYNQIYVNNNGHLTFTEPFPEYSPYSDSGRDIIFPLWTDLNNGIQGTVSYRQATDSATLNQVTSQINEYFPDVSFTASWVFIATWNQVSYYSGAGAATFQVVLVSSGDVSFVLMNYGNIDATEQLWLAGYDTVDSAHYFTIPGFSSSDLQSSSNINVLGRWAFKVDGGQDDVCSTLDCVDTEICQQRGGTYGCACREGQRPNSVHFDSMETCSSSSGLMSLSRCQLFEAGFSPSNLHLNDPSCLGTVQNGRVVFFFDNDDNVCGTTLSSNSTHFFYENAIQTGSGSGSGPIISRNSWLHLAFSCVYPLIQTLSMPMAIHAMESIVHRELPAGEGTYQIRMIAYHDAGFTTPFSGPVSIMVNQQIYVAVVVEGVDSRQLSNVLDNCWATPVDDIDHNIRWNLITGECPNPEDGTVEVLQNGISTTSRFSFRMFTFTGQSERIFLHCQVHLCILEGNNCALPCYHEANQRNRRSVDFHDTASISMSF